MGCDNACNGGDPVDNSADQSPSRHCYFSERSAQESNFRGVHQTGSRPARDSCWSTSLPIRGALLLAIAVVVCSPIAPRTRKETNHKSSTNQRNQNS